MNVGGKGSKYQDSFFNPTQLKYGIKVELEHTKSKRVAKAIAKDHLLESPQYYVELKKMEKKLGI
jgi:hypothetical protein